jgi:hypothetical protein
LSLDPWDTYFAMAPADPVDQQNGFVGNIIQIDHHFMDQDMRQSLSCARIRCWRVPGCR